MPEHAPDEVEKISRFRELSPAQKSMMLSARKESGKFTEGVLLAKGKEYLFRVVPPSLYLALAMTENEEKNQRYSIMQATGCDELGRPCRSQRISTRRAACHPSPLFSQTNRQWSARTNESSEFADPEPDR